jgi:DNA-binding PadR family transcriptional regulator
MSNPTETIQSHLSMFVLDVLRWANSYDSILNVINDHHTVGWRDVWGRPFSPAEIDSALTDLIQRGFVAECADTPNYYEITESGRSAWDEWMPPGDAGERVTISRLLKHWDPIGVFAGESDWPQDEYEGYVSPIISALRSGADEAIITRQLQQIRTDHMGLQPSPNADADAAREICHAWASLKAT